MRRVVPALASFRGRASLDEEARLEGHERLASTLVAAARFEDQADLAERLLPRPRRMNQT